MMPDLVNRVFRSLDRKEVELEVEEEMRFHLDQLKEQHLEQGMSPDQAREASRKRFGDVQEITRQCVEISARSRPLFRVLKGFFTLLFFAGVLVRIYRRDLHLSHFGDVLMMVAVSGRLFLYVRGLSPSSFFPDKNAGSPLRLNDREHQPVSAYDDKRRTPTERVISID
jgi:hypothetical protein